MSDEVNKTNDIQSDKEINESEIECCDDSFEDEGKTDETDDLYIDRQFVSWQEGFGYRKDRSKKDNENSEEIIKRTFMFNCLWHVNIHKKHGVYIVTTFIDEHKGHILNLQTTLEGDVMASKQYRMLTNNISNVLLDKKNNESGWVVEYQLDATSQALTHLLWMEPQQVKLYIRYGSVVNTAKTNMSLGVINQILGIYPLVIITDADPAIDTTITQIYLLTKHLHCIWHIELNIPKNLKERLCEDYKTFAKKFFQCWNKLNIETFECKYANLIENYLTVKSYLEWLYKSKSL
ncbi:8183_t:CDS:2 [Funneliformis mosseae]|uniref:8183_t:CDS:1 n=1 Tax=Funneliformis mosseae TaxID=27381 RepID=A0A9N9HMC8_FUNMO|nr:8183_t:CDS:2 [Funneliformis mosseae]